MNRLTTGVFVLALGAGSAAHCFPVHHRARRPLEHNCLLSGNSYAQRSVLATRTQSSLERQCSPSFKPSELSQFPARACYPPFTAFSNSTPLGDPDLTSATLGHAAQMSSLMRRQFHSPMCPGVSELASSVPLSSLAPAKAVETDCAGAIDHAG
ncbi:hypothetical protein R3P38DRAFT_2909589 [Favolaschia claudopus]|uniref:Secreted protein n=1 Tax=Favolaschia claudopus TaxID=2862362 RepID=A0AAW0C855_9AGAR